LGDAALAPPPYAGLALRDLALSSRESTPRSPYPPYTGDRGGVRLTPKLDAGDVGLRLS
jgi:hypothetical protein